jgi:squalene-hopene/tetraprenyl-beta-curcumene cyclase
MNNRFVWTCLLLSGFAAGIYLWREVPVHGASTTPATRWSQRTAAAYLDSREVWWQQWPRAQKDHGTLCISCHTVVPYAMARPALRRPLNETTMAAPEKIMVDSVEKRVTHWSEMVPFYSDEKSGPGKAVESHATEAVLNAIILASYDARQGHLRPITRTAFDEAWTLQEQTGDHAGGWKWQDFHLGPWESSQSAYQGAALLLFEAANAPDGYTKDPAIRPHLDRMREYLRREYAVQPLMNQLYVLWASAKDHGLLRKDERRILLEKLQTLQQPDGGWRLSSIVDWKRVDNSAASTESDGFATSLAVLVMEESGISRHNSTLQQGLVWLEQHQQKDGDWPAASMNKKRDPASDLGRFMSDAATAYAVLALEKAQ